MSKCIGGLAATSLIAAGLCAAPAAAGNLLVPSQFPTIQSAIDAAVDGDVVCVADGVYTGAGNKDLFNPGKAITVRSQNGPANCIIDCEGVGVAFFFVADEPPTSIIQGFTVQKGNGFPGGAAFFHHDADATFIDCVFRENTSTQGGAIFAENTSSATFIGCRFENNKADLGGGVYLSDSSDLTFLNCTFTGNTAADNGGAVFSGTFGATSRLIQCSITGNAAGGDGGGVFHGSGQLDVVGCTLADNDAASSGGAVAARGPGSVSITNSILFGDKAPNGVELALLDNPTQGGAAMAISFSDVMGGQAAAQVDPGSTLNFGAGNIDQDPLFVDLPAGDVRIAPSSPAADAGSNPAVPSDFADLDGDSDTAEPIPFDTGGLARFVDAQAPDTGVGVAPLVDMGANEQQSLGAAPDAISLAAGGTQTLSLNAGPGLAGRAYLVLGTVSGTAPGFVIDGQLVPLNIDAYTFFTLQAANSPNLVNTLAALGPAGESTALIVLPAGLSPGLVGTVLHHAYVVFSAPIRAVVLASNPVSLTLIP